MKAIDLGALLEELEELLAAEGDAVLANDVIDLVEGWLAAAPTQVQVDAALNSVWMQRVGHAPRRTAKPAQSAPTLTWERSISSTSLNAGRAGVSRKITLLRQRFTPTVVPESAVEGLGPRETAPLLTHVERPTEAAPDTEFEVRVWTSPSEPGGEVHLDAPVDDEGRTEVEVLVGVLNDKLRVVGGHRTWLKAKVGEPSLPAAFTLTGEAGLHRINVTFRAGGKAKLHTFQVRVRPDASPIEQTEVGQLADSADNTLLVLRRDARSLYFVWVVDGEARTFPHELEDDHVARLRQTCASLQDAARHTGPRRKRDLQSVGRQLAKWLLPQPIQAALAAAEGTLLIRSEAPWVPWPLLVVGDDHLGYRLAITEQPVQGDLPAELGGPVVLVDGDGVKLDAGELPGVTATVLTSEAALDERLHAEPIGALYVLGHGRLQDGVGLIEINGSDYRSAEVYDKPGYAGALVVLNACSAGQNDDLTGQGPWVTALLGSGTESNPGARAGAVVAPVFPVPIETARRFGQELFDQLTRGTPLPEAAKLARVNLRTEPLLLGYTVFSHYAARWVG